jgi:hypothetical protein
LQLRDDVAELKFHILPHQRPASSTLPIFS